MFNLNREPELTVDTRTEKQTNTMKSKIEKNQKQEKKKHMDFIRIDLNHK